MLSPSNSELDSALARKIVHGAQNLVHQLPRPPFVIDPVLRSIETRLAERGHLTPLPRDHFTPLWFIAETEQNIFLWRNGLSVADRDAFEFWIDVPQLIEKRRAQLLNIQDQNPFRSYSCESTSLGAEFAERESGYLQDLAALWNPLAGHAHALSYLAHTLCGPRPMVLLPIKGLS